MIDFDTLPAEDWVKVDAAGSHWRDGFRVARPILEADCLVSTGCLKTHQFGGVFTLSLKLHVGVVPTTRHGYGYMAELHASPHQQELIAGINAPFIPRISWCWMESKLSWTAGRPRGNASGGDRTGGDGFVGQGFP